MVRKLLDSGLRESAAERGARRREAVRRTLDRVGSGVGGSVKRLAFERVLTWCEQYYVLRENMRYHADLFLAALRFIALSAAERLVRAGALGTVGDVFFLEVDELSAFLRGRGDDPRALASRACTRRDEQARWASLEPPECISGDGDPAASTFASAEPHADGEHAEDTGMLSGVGVYPGVATGTARVVRSLDELQRLEPGEIVVASATDPSWTSMLVIAGALVVEMGGPLSHGAIVARELGIPAVVNVANATRVLATGRTLIVDGAGGTVRQLAPGQRFEPE